MRAVTTPLRFLQHHEAMAPSNFRGVGMEHRWSGARRKKGTELGTLKGASSNNVGVFGWI